MRLVAAGGAADRVGEGGAALGGEVAEGVVGVGLVVAGVWATILGTLTKYLDGFYDRT